MTAAERIRRVGIGTGALALLAMSASAVQADGVPGTGATGFASQAGTTVEMLTGPTCTWEAPPAPSEHADDHEDAHADDDADYDTSPHGRVNQVCDNDDENWWHGAPVIPAGGPQSELTLSWATDAQPVEVDTLARRAPQQADSPVPGAVTMTAISGDGGSCKNPCTFQHTDASTSGAITYIIETHWGDTTSTQYAVTFAG